MSVGSVLTRAFSGAVRLEVFMSLPSLTLAGLPVCFARTCLSAHPVSKVDMRRNDI